MRAVKALILAFFMAGLTSAEKGDTYSAELEKSTLPPGGPYIPGQVKNSLHLDMLLNFEH
jgi:hypothetical protein